MSKKSKIIWDDSAVLNLEKIWRYIAKDSLHFADKITGELTSAVLLLIDDPLLGPVEEILKKFNPEYRYIVYSHYKIIYRIVEDKIFIAAIFDTRQKPSKLKKIVKKNNPKKR